ncbi:MAG: hypothetical protein QOJ78_921, partial [Pseudonocardiales bacterium]|nr:hypothetical protein [Pseudonocardiales bacterium]
MSTDTHPAAPPAATTFPALAQERIRALRRMKIIAASLLLVAAVVYVLCRAVGHGNGAWGYLQAAAEASMVGGLADWFAVTALFRRPLGLPIPHTALIPTRKDQLGAQLGDFVTTNFLTTQNVVERLRVARLIPTLAAQLATPEVAARISRETTVAITAALQAVEDEDVTTLLLDLAHRDAGSR